MLIFVIQKQTNNLTFVNMNKVNIVQKGKKSYCKTILDVVGIAVIDDEIRVKYVANGEERIVVYPLDCYDVNVY